MFNRSVAGDVIKEGRVNDPFLKVTGTFEMLLTYIHTDVFYYQVVVPPPDILGKPIKKATF